MRTSRARRASPTWTFFVLVFALSVPLWVSAFERIA
jgi:hypothetical protein